MSEQHTPGPWSYMLWRDESIIHAGREGSHDSGFDIIAKTYTLDEFCADQYNGRLIAAAPELLAALQGVINILGSAESNASGNPEWDYVGPRVAAARAAIEKATGK